MYEPKSFNARERVFEHAKKTMTEDGQRVPGSVWQINERHDPGDGSRLGWVGAFVLCTEIKSVGIMGFVQMIETHDKHGSAYIRLKWDHIDFIGHAALVPKPHEDTVEEEK